MEETKISVIRLRRTRCWSECGIFPCRIVLLHLRRIRDYSEKFFFVRNELDTTLKLHTHTGLMEVSCADLWVGRVPKALTIRLRRTRCCSECGIFPCRIVLLHLRRSRDYSEKFFFVRNELDTTLKLHTHTGLMEVSCADLWVGRVPKALIPPSVERSFLLAA